MKSRYKRKACYLDADVLIEGYVDKYGFHPNSGVQCGFGTQKFSKRDIGKKIFFSVDDTPWEIYCILG